MSRLNKRFLLLGIFLLLAAFYLVGTKQRVKQIQGKTMGTYYNISYVAPLFKHPTHEVKLRAEEVLDQVNQVMSTYQEDSELMDFNRSPVGKPFKASKELVSLIHQSLDISRISNGAYDVTVGPLVNLWGFGVSGSKVSDKEDFQGEKEIGPEFIQWLLNNQTAEVPTEQEIAQAMGNVGYQYLDVDLQENTLTRQRDLFIDLSSIAKGYGVDQVALAMENMGIYNYTVEVGGEISISGNKLGNQAWNIAILGPAADVRAPSMVISPGDGGVGTSGNYLNYFEVDGNRYSHTIDPATGRPKMNRLAEVAVIADTVADADALATMFMVLGDQEGLALANREGIAAFFTYHSGEGFESVSSEAFKPFLPK